MADLLPCPFCGGTDLSSGGDDKFVGYSCKTCQATGPNHYGSYNWNTRPAAPVERLETVGYMHPKAKWSHWDKTAIQIRCVAGEKPEELVTRSQAEAIIVAERADKKIWMEKAAIEAERVSKLEADNAALTARVKALNTPIEAVDFLYKHGELTYGAAKKAIDLLIGNGFYVGKRAALEAKP